jgi:hypothetical protein
LEVIEKQAVCGTIFESEFVDLTKQLKLTIASAPPIKLNLNVRPGGFREKLRALTAKLSGMAPSVKYRIPVPEELAYSVLVGICNAGV